MHENFLSTTVFKSFKRLRLLYKINLNFVISQHLSLHFKLRVNSPKYNIPDIIVPADSNRIHNVTFRWLLLSNNASLENKESLTRLEMILLCTNPRLWRTVMHYLK